MSLPSSKPENCHLAFKVASLAELRAFYSQIRKLDLPVIAAIDSDVSLAFFFDDPEGNHIEIYWPTGSTEHLPISKPINLSAPEEALLREATRDGRTTGISARTSQREEDRNNCTKTSTTRWCKTACSASW